jgi:hypothetical protein
MPPTPTTPEPAVLKFVRSHHNKIGIIVDENLNCVAHSELRKRAARKMNFVVIDGDSGEDITRILLTQN